MYVFMIDAEMRNRKLYASCIYSCVPSASTLKCIKYKICTSLQIFVFQNKNFCCKEKF